MFLAAKAVTVQVLSEIHLVLKSIDLDFPTSFGEELVDEVSESDMADVVVLTGVSCLLAFVVK